MNKKFNSWIPLSETAYYIFISLNIPRHGYGIIKYVEELTEGRIILGSGTIYTTLGKMKKANLITVFQDEERKTVYTLTSKGKELLFLEIERIKKMYENTLKQEGLFYEKDEN